MSFYESRRVGMLAKNNESFMVFFLDELDGCLLLQD